MRFAGEAIAEGDVTAIAPARRKLMDKTNRVAANLSADEPEAAAEAAEGAPSGDEAAALRGAVSGERRLKEIPRPGVRASP